LRILQGFGQFMSGLKRLLPFDRKFIETNHMITFIGGHLSNHSERMSLSKSGLKPHRNRAFRHQNQIDIETEVVRSCG
jgi:hypothetical protein